MVIVIVTTCTAGGISNTRQRGPHHDILLHCDVYEGERSSVDKDVAYSEETGLEEVIQPDISCF
jgi:hypothetical protein